jgi:thiamine transport system substrate-binding protein
VPTFYLKGHELKKLTTILVASSLLLTGCAPADQAATKVTLVAHDSFAISDESIAQFQEASGFELEIIRAGDAGSLTNRLVLTEGAPIADVVFGIDNTFRGIADENGIIEGDLVPVDYADVCFNYDRVWFEERGITPPASWRDLTRPAFNSLTVVTNPLSSSPGLAFLASTVAAFGEPAFEQYWKELRDNGVMVASGWEEAYFTYFSGSSGNGEYPIVLSYSSSPAAEIREDGKSQTAALLDECFRQTEFIGTLAGSKNPDGAKALVEFLLSESFQNTMPGLMYVYPVNESASIPAEWGEFGPAARSTIGGNLSIAIHREKWQTKWSAIFD